MKTIIFSLLTMLLFSCAEHTTYPKYELIIMDIDNDSIQAKKSKFITETCKAATNNLKTDDYEDVDDMVEEVTYSANRIFEHKIRGLRVYTNAQSFYEVYPEIMTAQEKKMYDQLMLK